MRNLQLTFWKLPDNIFLMDYVEAVFERLLERVNDLGRGGRKLLSDRLNKAPSWISKKLGKNRKITLRDFIAICDALKINPGSLFEIDGKKEFMTAEEFLRHLIREEIDLAKKQ